MAKVHTTLSYQSRLTLICLLLVTLPLGVVGMISIYRSYTQMEESIQLQADQSVQFLDYALTDYFSDIEELTVLPLFDENIIRILMKHSSANDEMITFEDNHQLTVFVTGSNYNKSMVSQVSIYLLNGTSIHSDGKVGRWDQKTDSWTTCCDMDRYRSFVLIHDGNIYACRALEQPLFGAHMGYIRIRLDASSIASLIQKVPLPEDSNIYIYNEFDQFIYPLALDDVDPSGLDEESDRYRYSIATSDSANLRIVIQLSRNAILSELQIQCLGLVMLYALMLAVGWLLAYYASGYMTRPIVKLKKKMEMVGQGRFETRMNVRSDDEIGQLEMMFNSMTENLENLIHEVFDVRLAGRDAQISALQSQINPHFLYNTLETINMMAISMGAYDISETVSDLGALMRYCVSNECHFATLEEEFRFVSAYYDIQRLRHDNLRSLTILCQPAYRSIAIPKLLLQPFVENIIQHGLGEEAVDICVSVHAEEGDVIIAIENNGLPLTQEVKQRIHRSLSEAEQESTPKARFGKGYGLANVHCRLRLIYGNHYGIDLDDSYTNGARFLLRLKRKETPCTES